MPEYNFASPIYLTLVAIYFFVASITTYDIRLIQERKFNNRDAGELPTWTGVFMFMQWGLFIALFVLNWKLALILFVVKFILKFIPVLEIIGGILMIPFFIPPKDKSID